MRHMFDVDFKNIVHQFKANLSDEVASTMTVFGFEYRFNLHLNGPKAFQSVRRTFIFESVRTQTSASAYSSKYYELRCLVRKFILLNYTVFKSYQSMPIIRLQSQPQLKKCKWKLIFYDNCLLALQYFKYNYGKKSNCTNLGMKISLLRKMRN